MPSYESRWEFVKSLGAGAQGKVSLVHDKQKTNRDSARIAIQTAGRYMGSMVGSDDVRQKHAKDFVDAIRSLIAAEKVDYKGALKELHKPIVGQPEKEIARIRREIATMQSLTHNNLLPIFDANPEDHWFVARYYERSTLHSNLGKYKGNALRSLMAFRGLVSGVACLHEKGIIHRDIKPKNVYVADSGDLILGDFGIVFFQDDQHTRITETLDQAGSRDWMPGWALDGRVDEVRATSDVFSLGKVLWAMIAGRERLALWYFIKDGNNLELLYPGDSNMPMVNDLLSKCVVENEEECLRSATELLKEVDLLIAALSLGGELLGNTAQRNCRVCAKGQYVFEVDRDQYKTRHFGLDPTGSRTYKIFVCNYCGHVQLFFFGEHKSLPAW